MLAAIRTSLFGISTRETSVARRGFRSARPHITNRLEEIGRTFLAGYHAALRNSEPHALAHELEQLDREVRGFAYEGAAMALALQDQLAPWRGDRLQNFLDGPGAAHTYMVHVGAGWAHARLPWRTRWPQPQLDPLLGWLAVDGYGFHEGYFKWPRAVSAQARPTELFGYACRAFDQGLGRSLWFVEGADSTQISETIGGFPPSRQADLWSGVGLACAYAGGVDESTIAAVRAAAGPFQPELAQGAAFAAKTRQRAANPTSHTELACLVLCDCTTVSAAAITDQALIDLPTNRDVPAYEIWRQRIRDTFVRHSSPESMPSSEQFPANSFQ